MHSDYSFHKPGRTSPTSSTRKPATDMPDLPAKRVQAKSPKPKAKRERKPTIYEQSFGSKLKALVTGKAPKNLNLCKKKRESEA